MTPWTAFADRPPPRDGLELDLWAGGRRYPDCHFHKGEWLRWASNGVDEEPTWRVVENPTHWLRVTGPEPVPVSAPVEGFREFFERTRGSYDGWPGEPVAAYFSRLADALAEWVDLRLVPEK